MFHTIYEWNELRNGYQKTQKIGLPDPPHPYLRLSPKNTNFFYSFPKGGRIHDIHGYLKIYEGCFIYRQRLDAEAGEVGQYSRKRCMK